MVHWFAWTTAALLLGAVNCAGAESLGRLFFSPDERAVLEQARQGVRPGSGPVSAAEQITLDGIVRRSSGKSTTWINGLPQHEEGKTHGVTASGQAAKSSVLLMLPTGKQLRLKPGQTFDASKGRVREGYEDAAEALRQD